MNDRLENKIREHFNKKLDEEYILLESKFELKEMLENKIDLKNLDICAFNSIFKTESTYCKKIKNDILDDKNLLLKTDLEIDKILSKISSIKCDLSWILGD